MKINIYFFAAVYKDNRRQAIALNAFLSILKEGD